MEEVVDFELQFRKGNFFSTELIFELDEFVLELYAEFPFVVEALFETVFGFFELFTFILQHKLKFGKVVVLGGVWVKVDVLR